MPLSVGDKLGPYEILALIGKGGMGEVYRAHDDRLRRDVAIKVSNAQFTERFTREARTIASLNHTNICHLYDVGPNYLVMEYVEGAGLKGPLDFNDALPIIHQLIDGIEAAHEKNIVHRDLKPAMEQRWNHPVLLARHHPARRRGGWRAHARHEGERLQPRKLCGPAIPARWPDVPLSDDGSG